MYFHYLFNIIDIYAWQLHTDTVGGYTLKDKSKFMFYSMIILSILTVVVLILSCIHMFADPQFDMSSWVMVVTLGIFAILMIVCILLEKFHVRKMGFYLLHIGLVLVLIGCFAYFINGHNYQVTFQQDPNNYYMVTTPDENGEPVDLGMDIKIMDATVEYYSPTYTVYQIDTQTGEMTTVESDLEVQDGYLDLGPYGGTSMSEAELNASLATDPATGAVYYYITENTAVIRTLTPKHYEAKLSLCDVKEERFYGTDADPYSLTVNHPLRCGDWKVYLMGISSAGDTDYVTLTFKKDPGEWVTVTGIVLLIAGAFLCSFLRPAKPKADATAKVATKADNKKRKGAAK